MLHLCRRCRLHSDEDLEGLPYPVSEHRRNRTNLRSYSRNSFRPCGLSVDCFRLYFRRSGSRLPFRNDFDARERSKPSRTGWKGTWRQSALRYASLLTWTDDYGGRGLRNHSGRTSFEHDSRLGLLRNTAFLEHSDFQLLHTRNASSNRCAYRPHLPYLRNSIADNGSRRFRRNLHQQRQYARDYRGFCQPSSKR